MDRIKNYVSGDIHLKTITLNGLMVVIINNNNKRWIGLTRKVKSFKEINIIEQIKATCKTQNRADEDTECETQNKHGVLY